jgi:hypothetical protein
MDRMQVDRTPLTFASSTQTHGTTPFYLRFPFLENTDAHEYPQISTDGLGSKAARGISPVQET